MIRMLLPAIFATTMLTAVTPAHAAGGLYKHDASIAHHGYNIPIIDGNTTLTQSGATLRDDIDKGYKPSPRAAAPVYQNSVSNSTVRSGVSGNGAAANLQGIAQGGSAGMPAQGQLQAQQPVQSTGATTAVSPNGINAGSGSVVSGAATSPQAAETSPTAPIGRNSTDSIRSGIATSPRIVGTSSNLDAGATANSPMASSSSNSSASSSTGSSSTGSSSNSGFTGDASNSGSTSTSNGGVGGANGGSSSMGGGSSIGNASGGSLGGGAGAGAGGGGGQ